MPPRLQRVGVPRAAARAAAAAAAKRGAGPSTQPDGGARKRRKGGGEGAAEWAPGAGGVDVMLASLLAFLALFAGLVGGAQRARAALGVTYVLVLRHPQKAGAVRVYVGAAEGARRPRDEWRALRGEAPIGDKKVAGPLRTWHGRGWRATGEEGEASMSLWAWGGCWACTEDWLTLLLMVLLGADCVRGGAWACADWNPAQHAGMWGALRHALGQCVRCGDGSGAHKMAECPEVARACDAGPLLQCRLDGGPFDR
eukprot:gene9581-5440_t